MKNCETSFNWTWNINFSIDTRTFPFHLMFFLLFHFTTGCFIIKGKQWVSEEENVIKVIGMINFYCFWKKQCLCIFFYFFFSFSKSSSYCSSSTILELRGRKNLMVLLMESIDWKYTTEYSLLHFFSVLFCSVLLHKMRINGFSIFFSGWNWEQDIYFTNEAL